MFGQLKNMANMLGQAKEMRARMEQVQKELAQKAVEGQAGAGAVRVTITGKLEVVGVHIDRHMLGALTESGSPADQLMVQDLIKEAFNEALGRAQEMIQQEMAKVTGDMDLGALGKMLGQ